MLYGICVLLTQKYGALGEARVFKVLVRSLATVAFHKAPRVAARDGCEPRAKAAIVRQSIETLK
jgi:hypothetical protein